MKNQMAIDVLNRMRRDGLDPTPEDVIRLNAFGLKCDEAQGRRADDSANLLPRVAWLDGGVTFRQPSVGHEIWMRSVMRFCARDDYETLLAINCYALSRPASELPDENDPAAVQKAAADFCERMKPYTKDVLYAAINYARFGIDASADEEPPHGDDDEKEADEISPEACVAVGSLVEGVSYLWGLSLRDIREMRRDQLDAAVRASLRAHGLEFGKAFENEAIAKFNAVAAEIRERLEKEKKNG